MLLGRRLLVMSLCRIWKWSATRFWIVSIVRRVWACSRSMSCRSRSAVGTSSGLLKSEAWLATRISAPSSRRMLRVMFWAMKVRTASGTSLFRLWAFERRIAKRVS